MLDPSMPFVRRILDAYAEAPGSQPDQPITPGPLRSLGSAMGPADFPLSPLSAPTAIGMQAVGRAGGRPLQGLVLRANAILAKYAPEWAKSAENVPVTFDPQLPFLGAYSPAGREIVLGPRTWARTDQGIEGAQRPLATLLHEASHDRIYDVPGASSWTPPGWRPMPWGLAHTNASYAQGDVAREVLADAMRTRLLRKALPEVDILGAKLGGWYDPERTVGWLKASDVPDLKRLLDALVR